MIFVGPVPFALYEDLLGKPFVDEARGPEAYDCLGLAMEFQRRRGAVLPPYLSHPEELHRQLSEGGILDGTHRLKVAEPGCVVLLRTGIYERHLGSMLDPFRMLHTQRETGGAVIERVLSPQWEKLVLGFYRVEVIS